MGKAIAVFGGVVCEITQMDIVKLDNYISKVLKLVEENLVKVDSKTLLAFTDADLILNYEIITPTQWNLGGGFHKKL